MNRAAARNGLLAMLVPLAIALTVPTQASRSFAADAEADVVIYGGTPAGIIAAVAARREGASVIVIEPSRWLGGMVTGGLCRTDIGQEAAIGGGAREFFLRAAQAYAGKSMWYAEPHVNAAVFDDMIDENQVRTVVGQPIRSVVVTGGRIVSLSTSAGATYKGRCFIDCSYEGDLMALGGVPFRIGRESQAEYGEPLAGFRVMPIRPCSSDDMSRDCPCIGGKGPHYVHGTPSSIAGLDASKQPLPGVCSTTAATGSADTLTQAYNFRIVVTRTPGNRIPFPKPGAYDPRRYELLLRLIAAYPGIRFGRIFHLGRVANDKYDLNSQGLVSTDLPGGNDGYILGDELVRMRIREDHQHYIQGLLWFLGHDQRVPADLRAQTEEWGLCRDEFVDNQHWPYALYVREARRLVGSYVMVQQDVQRAVLKPDAIAMGSFAIDCHIVQRVVVADGTIRDEGSFEDAPVRPYQIPYRCMTPKPGDCANLLVPVCLSASHVAYCSLRMEPVYMALGQAAGIAAAWASRSGSAVQSIDVPALQARLRERGAVLGPPADR